MKICEKCGYTVKCCEDDCPRCGSELKDERDIKGCSVGTS